MSIQAFSWATSQTAGSPTLKLVLTAISNYADEDGRCWPSQQRLVADTELSVRAVRNALIKLEDKGFLKRIVRRRPDGSRASDAIQLILDRDPSSVQQPAPRAGSQPAGNAGSDEGPSTGTTCRTPRHHMPEQPAPRAALTTFEPSKNHQRNHSSAASPPAAAETVDRFDEFWAAYPKRGLAANPKKPAREKFAKAVKAGADPEAIIGGARRYAEIEKRSGRFGTEKVAQAQTWLNQERWGDYPAVPASVASSASRAEIFGRG
ncbi:hypothetical protein GCM10019059_42550 [Camelimonas fluminis]|uniref:Helix-turn-helix domain-containing protein n=1 Tax=Camelimonas fluminis TaxID=1576911 RepID=A0ABV7UMR2_9HYPH|nr:helix-turn-helix domain-containing protein [Camelimonas fluminis]GHE79543.1 hypothetical protein GCM10019059_42550 [Camelimonas fluminis]